MTPEQVTVLVDSREKRPLLFPSVLALFDPGSALGQKPSRIFRIQTKLQTLDSADYRIEHHESKVGIERKQSLDELSQNLMGLRRSQFLSAMQRLWDSTDWPILYIERLPRRSTEGWNEIHQKTLDLLGQAIQRYSLHLIWGGIQGSDSSGRTRLGEVLLRLMLSRTHTLRPRGAPGEEYPKADQSRGHGMSNAGAPP